MLAQFKVGHTPFSFLENQVYPVTNQLRAGARRFFAVGCKAPFDKTPLDHEKQATLLASLPADLRQVCETQDFNEWIYSFFC